MERAMIASPRANILLVDDDRRSLEALQELLRALRQNLVLAYTGEDALRCVLKSDFAVILLDVRMPGIDGFETARLIRQRERSRRTPIIFLTGASEDLPSVFRGYEAGAVDYIVKPLVPEVLKSKVSVLVELYNNNAALAAEVVERKLAETQLRESQESLRALAARLQSVREGERTRIAREIHDELGQALTGLKMHLTGLTNDWPGDRKRVANETKSMLRLIDETIRSVQRIASGLRPEVLDEAGIVAAIGWQAKDFQKRTGIRCKVALPLEDGGLDRERSTAVFRIFQELLTNVARHASATKVDVMLRLNQDALALEVQDNGRGIAHSELDSPKSLGLLGMRERASLLGGSIAFTGKPGEGTKVTVLIPLRPD